MIFYPKTETELYNICKKAHTIKVFLHDKTVIEGTVYGFTWAVNNEPEIADIETLQIFRIIRELTPEIIRVFVERIEIFKPEQMNGHRVQKMRIVWNCIEEFMPLQPQNNKKSA